jgi:outer membrane protein assembly factor BamD
MIFQKIFTMLVISVLMVAVFSSGCGTERPKGKTPAETLFKEAQELASDSRYLLATERLNQLKSEHPYSFYVTAADLLRAEILFKQQSYVEAAAMFSLFRDLHPKHEKLSYVIWMMAESYSKQLPKTFDRDLSAAPEAIKYYTEVIERYPDSEYVAKSKEQIEKVTAMLRNRDKYVADFYFKTGVFDAARYRYLDILKTWHEPALMNHSMMRVVEASFMFKDYQDCVRYAALYSEKIDDPARARMRTLGEKCEKLYKKVLAEKTQE